MTQVRAPDSRRTAIAAVGSQAEFDAFVRPHWAVLARVARRLSTAADFEDVLQDALVTAWIKRDQFDETRGSARSWLLAIVIDKTRKLNRRRPFSTVELADASEQPADADLRLDVERAIRELPRRQREVVTLFYLVGLPVRDVADALDCSEGTVKSTLADARARLATTLSREDLT